MPDDYQPFNPTYVIGYTCLDIPGMLNTVSGCLGDHDYNITAVSTSSGNGTQSTFITCQKTYSADQGNSTIDEATLKLLVSESLRELYKSNDRYSKEDPNVTVKAATDPLKYRYRMFMQIGFKDDTGVLAAVTTILRTCFTLETIIARTAFSKPIVSGGTLATLSAQFIPIPDKSRPLTSILTAMAATAPDTTERKSIHYLRFVESARKFDATFQQNGEDETDGGMERRQEHSMAKAMEHLTNLQKALAMADKAYDEAVNAKKKLKQQEPFKTPVGSKMRIAAEQIVTSLVNVIMLLNSVHGRDLQVTRLVVCYRGWEHEPHGVEIKGTKIARKPKKIHWDAVWTHKSTTPVSSISKRIDNRIT